MEDTAHGVAPRAGSATTRRPPSQKRSRERRDHILAVALALIERAGSDHLKMSEVAARAKISIGSLYQYFPDKRAIILCLAERYSAESRACIEAAFAEVVDLAGLRTAFVSLLDQYHALMLAEPARRDIWSGMQADKSLIALELAESRACGALLAEAMRRVAPEGDKARRDAAAFLIWQLGEATMRLALATGRQEGDALLDAFKRMSLRQIIPD